MQLHVQSLMRGLADAVAIYVLAAAAVELTIPRREDLARLLDYQSEHVLYVLPGRGDHFILQATASAEQKMAKEGVLYVFDAHDYPVHCVLLGPLRGCQPLLLLGRRLRLQRGFASERPGTITGPHRKSRTGILRHVPVLLRPHLLHVADGAEKAGG